MLTLKQLVVGSDFKKYHFIVDYSKAIEGKELSFEIKLKDGSIGLGTFKFENLTTAQSGAQFYELAENCDWTFCNACYGAFIIDKSRLFKFSFMEHTESELYIHLVLK